MQPIEKLPIADVLEHYGAQQIPIRHRWAKMKCPFHDDSQASASVNTEDGKFKCFACDINGDGLDLIMEQEGLDFAGAVELAEKLFGRSVRNVLPESQGKQRRPGLLEKPGNFGGQRSVFQARSRRKPLAGA